MNKIFEKAYAKINIGLKVGKKRSDGFHNIETLMARINLCDDISLENSDNIVIEGMDIPIEENLIYKVIMFFRDKYYIKRGVKVVINKVIPIGAGLGGGSSDAAAVIRGLNKLWGLNLSVKKMEEIGQEIGSDVSFFVSGKTCIVKGKGEILKKIDYVLPYKIVLVVLPYSISTKTIYENYNSNNYSSFKYKTDSVCLKNIKNDLESVYVNLYPDIFELITNIKNDLNGVLSLMSGSGPSVFALYNKDTNVDNIISFINKKYKVLTFEVVFL